MDDTPTTSARRKRKATTPSVIEATTAAPMPIVEAPVAADPAPEPIVVAAAPHVAAPATPPAAVPAAPQKETVMNTETVTQTIEQNQDRAQAFMGDMNDRTKGAMEKGAKLVEELSAFNKGNIEAIVESSKIAARAIETMGQDAAAFAKTAFEQQTAAWRQLASVKSPTEFMKLQSEMIRQSFDQMVQQSSRSTETVMKLAGEVAQPISNRMAIAADKMKVAA